MDNQPSHLATASADLQPELDAIVASVNAPPPDLDAAAAGALRNLAASWRTLCNGVPGAAFTDVAGCFAYWTGLTAPYYNGAFLTSSPADSTGAVDRLVSFFESTGMPFFLRVADPEARETLSVMQRNSRLVPRHDFPLLVLSPLTTTAAAAPVPSLDIREVDPARDLPDYIETWAVCFGDPIALMRAATPAETFTVGGARGYMGYVNGDPVATVMLLNAGQVAGIYGVATRPAFRRRGFGRAITVHALEQARRMGCTMATLQSSGDVGALYEDLGFRTALEYRQFAVA